MNNAPKRGNATKLKTTAIIAAGALFIPGCANLSPTENALLFGGVAGAVTGTTLALSGVDAGSALAIAGGTSLAVGAGAYIFSRQAATARQRQVALAHARAAEARLGGGQPETRGADGHGDGRGKRAVAGRYIAVDTEAAPQTPAATKPVMIYDTQSSRIVGNEVYNLRTSPRKGSSQKYDTMTAQYVGR